MKHIILIVEDDGGLVELITERISLPHCIIQVASSGIEAAELLDKHEVSLLLLDYSLPDMTGYDFIVSQQNKGKKVPPFIVSTGCGDERIAVDLMKLGARDYIVKDASFLDLIPYAVHHELEMIVEQHELAQTKERLAELNLMNQQIISNKLEGIVVLDLEKKYKMWNHFMEILTGIKADEIVGKTIYEVPSLLIYDEIMRSILPVDAHLQGKEIEFFFEIADTGKSGWASVTAGRLGVHQHLSDGYLFIVHDITERKKADILLKNSKEELLDLFENAPIGYHEFDLEGRLIRINQTGLKMLGYDKEEIMGRYIWELALDSKESKKRILRKSQLKKLENEVYERVLVCKDGSLIDVLISESFTYSETGEISGVRSSIQNITERKIAEKEAERISKRFQAIIENSPDGFVMLSKECKFLYLSPSTIRMFGYSLEEAFGFLPQELTHPDDLENVLAQFSRIFQDPTFVPTLEYRFRHKEGHWIWIESTFSNLLNDPAIEALVINYRNVDERKKAEENLLLDEKRLESLNRINEYDSVDVKDLQDFALSEAIGLTGSTLGLIAYYDESSRGFQLKSWSHYLHAELPEEMNPGFVVRDKGIWHDLIKWRKPMIINDMSNYNKPSTGRVMLKDINRFLAVPVFMSNKIVAIVAVANKKSSYDESDVRQLNLMMDSVLRIIDRKEYTLKLNESEAKFRTIFESSSIGKSITTLDGKLSVNKAFADMLGYTIEELSNINWRDLTYPEDIEVNENHLGLILEGQTDSVLFEKRYYHKSGEIVWVQLATTLICDVAGEPLYYITESTDITARKMADIKIRESEERYRILAENSRDVIWKIDLNGKYSYVSPSVFELRGYLPEEVIGQSLIEIVGESSLGFVQEKFAVSLKDYSETNRMESGYVELEQLRKDGTKVWTESTIKLIVDENKQPIGYIGATRDISARKAVEQELQQGRDLLRELFKESSGFIESDAVDYKQISDRVLKMSGAKYCSFNLYEENGKDFYTIALSGVDSIHASLNKIFGYSLLGKKWKYDPVREKAIGDNVLTRFNSLADLSGSVLPKSVVGFIMRMFNAGEAWILQITRKNKPVGDFTLIFEKGKSLQYRELLGLYASQVGLYVERVKYESALRKSEEIYRNLVEKIPDGVYKSTHYGKFLNVNPGMVRMLGYDNEQELLNVNILTDLYLEISHRDDVRVQKSNGLMSVFPLKKKDGSIIWVEDHGWYNKDENGNILTHEGVLRDITQRMEDEEALRNNEAKFRLMFQNNPQPMFIYDLESLQFIDANQASVLHYGFTLEEILQMKVSELRPESELDKLLDHIDSARKSSANQQVQTKHLKKDGTVIDVEVYTSSITVGQRAARQVLVIDITEQLKAQAALKASEANLQEALKLGMMAFWEYDHTRQVFIFNDELYGIYNTSAELQGGAEMQPAVYAQRFVHPEDQYMVDDEINKALESTSADYSSTFDHRVVCPDGTLKYINVIVKIAEMYDGHPIRFFGASQDITQRKLAELMLENSELFFRQSQEAAHIGSYILHFDTGIWESSSVLDDIFGIDESFEKNFQSWITLVHEDDKVEVMEYFSKDIFKRKVPFDKECRIRRVSDGQIRWVHGIGELVLKNERVVQMIGTIQDITDRKYTELELQARIDELVRFQKVTVGRELMMINLKKEVNQLLISTGRDEKYKIFE